MFSAGSFRGIASNGNTKKVANLRDGHILVKSLPPISIADTWLKLTQSSADVAV